MDTDHLVKMANEIGAFFETATATREDSIASVSQHLRSFWEPRMRKEIITYVNRGDGDLKDIVREAVLRLDAESKPC